MQRVVETRLIKLFQHSFRLKSIPMTRDPVAAVKNIKNAVEERRKRNEGISDRRGRPAWP